MFLAGSIAFARPADAQRSGFIIGIGLGPGTVFGLEPGLPSYSSVPDRGSKSGTAVDFHIGWVVGDSFELYYVQKGTIISTDVAGVSIGSGMLGFGFSYPLNPRFSINGGMGDALWTELGPDAPIEHAEGLGLVGGVRHRLNEGGRWWLGFDITYGEPFPDFTVLGAQFTINLLSH
jgi:hypothetical protein